MPYNADPDDPITVLRLMTNLEALWGFTQVYPDNEEETAYLAAMKKKYYSMYFRMKKQEKAKANETEDNSSQKMQE